MVVESQPFGSGRSAHDEELRLLRAVARFDVDADVLVWRRDDRDHWGGTLNHVQAHAAREGIVEDARV